MPTHTKKLLSWTNLMISNEFAKAWYVSWDLHENDAKQEDLKKWKVRHSNFSK